MSEKRWTIAGVIAAVVFGVPAWWAMFIEHPETVGTTITVLRALSPVVMFAIGAFTGYKRCSWKMGERHSRELTEKDEECTEKVAAKETEIEKIRRDCERMVFEATMPLDRTIRLTKPQAEVVVGMIDRQRAGEDTVLSARRGGDAALDSLAAQGVLHKEPFKSFYDMFDYTMDPEWLSLFRKHESEVRDIAAR